MINKLRAKKDANEDTETHFLLSDSVYANAKIAATEKVSVIILLIFTFLHSIHLGLLMARRQCNAGIQLR